MPTSFEEWIGQRGSVSWGSNVGVQPLPFQNWRRFKEAFAPELIARAVGETSQALGRPVVTTIDPFAGSGTTLLASQFLGLTAVGIEVNPYLADLAEAKLVPIDGDRVARALAEVLASSRARAGDASRYYRTAPNTFVEPGIKGRFLFHRVVADRLCGLLDVILGLRDMSVRRFLRVLLGSAALEVCNAVVSGKGRRYRRNWEERTRTPEQLDQAFIEAVEGAVFDAVRYGSRQSLDYSLMRGDAREVIKQVERADVAIFSPPYPNSFDYTDVYNIELWALGYLRTSGDNLSLRRSTLRSQVQIKRDMSAIQPLPLIAGAIDRLRCAPVLWDRTIPDMIGAYFADLAGILLELNQLLPDRGRVYMVVGDSRYSGVDIPVAAGLAELAPRVGYTVEKIEPFRSMRASPQQGGRPELAESLVTLAVRSRPVRLPCQGRHPDAKPAAN